MATALLGDGVWIAFLGGVREATMFLERGTCPFYRMISLYAALRTAGFSHALALSGNEKVLSLAGISLFAMLWLTWRMLQRERCASA